MPEGRRPLIFTSAGPEPPQIPWSLLRACVQPLQGLTCSMAPEYAGRADDAQQMRGGLVRANAGKWRRWYTSLARPRGGIPLNMSGPSQPGGVLAKRVLAVLLGLAITAVAAAQYRIVRGLPRRSAAAVGFFAG